MGSRFTILKVDLVGGVGQPDREGREDVVLADREGREDVVLAENRGDRRVRRPNSRYDQATYLIVRLGRGGDSRIYSRGVEVL